MDTLLLYGAYGYTGELIARETVARGGSPVVAGRDRDRVVELADELGVEGRTFDLDPKSLEDRVDEFDAVLNCAGPFVRTAEPLVRACLETETNYLDITGEFRVFERLSQLDERARNAGVTVLPGVGFEVVPSDCLAAFLAEALPEAHELSLAIASPSSISRGTAKTAVDLLGSGGIVRRRGRLVRVPTAYETREIDFGPDFGGVQPAVTVPWGDVVTAAHSTDIEDITVYATTSRRAVRAFSAGKSVQKLLGTRPVKSALERLIDATIDGPDGTELARGRALLWGEVTDGVGDRVARGRIVTPNPYALTVDAAVTAAQKVLVGDAPSGYQTPATAFGADFVLECADVRRDLLQKPEPLESGAVSDNYR